MLSDWLIGRSIFSGGGSGNSGFSLPVVEIADITAITVDENAKLTACIGMPIILVAMESAVVCNYSAADGFPMYLNEFLGGSLGTLDGINWGPLT